MAKALTVPVDEQRSGSLGTWILLSVSVAVLVAIAVSVPHLIGHSGWASGRSEGTRLNSSHTIQSRMPSSA